MTRPTPLRSLVLGLMVALLAVLMFELGRVTAPSFHPDGVRCVQVILGDTGGARMETCP